MTYKQTYNTLLAREQKAIEWMETATEEELTKHMPNYDKLLKEINRMIADYGIKGKEILEGFCGKSKI